jgi:hypothetical protein
MTLAIDLNPAEEKRLAIAARQAGLPASELVKRLAFENLPTAPVNHRDSIEAKLSAWQDEDGIQLAPDISPQDLFSRWAEEDSHVTPEEQAFNDRIYSDIEKNGIPRVRI